MDSERLHAATRLYNLLHSEAPPIALRELIEAMLGLKCSRVDVSTAGLERLKELSVEYGFGVAVARFKTIPGYEPAKGDWSDHARYTTLDDPEGLMTIYLGPSLDAAKVAREAEAFLGDEAFGELLSIPECCRQFYNDNRIKALARGDDYLWLSIAATKNTLSIPAGANIIGQYFGLSLISHYPCSLYCRATRRLTAERREIFNHVSRDWANALSEGHLNSYLLIEDIGMVSYPNVNIVDDQVRPTMSGQVIGAVPSEFLECDALYQEDGCVVGLLRGKVRIRSAANAVLVGVSKEW